MRDYAIAAIESALAAPAPKPKNAWSNCSEILRGIGQTYPRTCHVCGLGPCKATRDQFELVGLTPPAPKPVLWRDPAYDLTARLCAIDAVDRKHGCDLIRRETVMDFVVRWRVERDKMPTPYTAPPDTAALQARITKLEAALVKIADTPAGAGEVMRANARTALEES
jgi:hypothetical protein